MKCPNKNHEEYKTLIDKFGEDDAFLAAVRHDKGFESFPTVDEARELLKRKPTLGEKFQRKYALTAAELPEKARGVFNDVRAFVINAKKSYLAVPEEVSSTKRMLKKHFGNIEMRNLDFMRLHEGMSKLVEDGIKEDMDAEKSAPGYDPNEKHLSPEERYDIAMGAISKYIDAGGDKGKLADHAEKSKFPISKYYEKAQHLNDNELKAAQVAQYYFKRMGEESQAAGILDELRSNYVARSIKFNNKREYKDFNGQGQGFKKNPKYAKERKFDEDFDVEQWLDKTGAGELKSHSILDRMADYSRSSTEAIETRKLLYNLLHKKETDSRPTVVLKGSGRNIDKNFLVNPNTRPRTYKGKPIDTSDYISPNHSSFRDWKFVGNKTLMQGDFLVHPDAWKAIKNAVEQGYDSPVLKFAIDAQRRIKRNVAVGPFHLNNLAQRAWAQGVNTWDMPEVTPNDPFVRKFVDHGGTLGTWQDISEMSEGTGTQGSLVEKIVPGVKQITDYTFKDFIPRVKLATFKKLVADNTAKYPKYSKDQILDLSVDEVNDLYGGINHRIMDGMTHSKKFQQLMSAVFFAPDYMQANIRYVGKALTPEGHAARVGIIRAAAAAYLLPVAINYALSNGQDGHWDKPFKVIVGDRSYMLSSVLPAMIYRAAIEPQKFLPHRLSAVPRMGMELSTGRNNEGWKRDFSEQIGDTIESLTPIPAQGAARVATDVMKGKDISDTVIGTLLRPLLGMVGVTSSKEKK